MKLAMSDVYCLTDEEIWRLRLHFTHEPRQARGGRSPGAERDHIRQSRQASMA